MENNIKEWAKVEDSVGVETWQNLTAKDEIAEQTSWDDLQQVEFRDKMEFTPNDILPREKLPRLPYEVPKNYKGLSKEALELCCYNPKLLGRCEMLAKKSGVNFAILERVLARKYDMSDRSNLKMLDDVSDQGVIELAEMYDYVDIYAGTGFEILHEKSDKEIGETFRKFELMRKEFGGEEKPSEVQKMTFWNRAKMKFLQLVKPDERKRNRELERGESQRQFFAHYLFFEQNEVDLMDDESVVALTKKVRRNIESENGDEQMELVRVIEISQRGKRPLKECVDYLDMREEISERAIDKDSVRLQQQALKIFYEEYGMEENDKTYLRETILPMVDSYGLPLWGNMGPQSEALSTALKCYGHDQEGRERMNLALQELMPLAGNYMNLMNGRRDAKKELANLSLMNFILSEPMELNKMREMTDYYHETFAPMLERADAMGDNAMDFVEKASKTTARKLRVLENTEKRRETVDNDATNVEKLLTFVSEADNEIDLRTFEVSAEATWVRNAAGLRLDVAHLAMSEGVPEEFLDYINNDLDAKIRDNDPTLEWILGYRNLRGEESLKNYEFRCVTTKMSPRNLNRLLLSRRELPTGNAHKLEQNRIDALALEGKLLKDHGFIHDEEPKTHELLSTMLNYYEVHQDKNQNEQTVSEADKALNQIVAECQQTKRYGDLASTVYDLKNYEISVKGQVYDDLRSREYDEKTVDILRRLVENTERNVLEKPETKDEVLNQLMRGLDISPNPTGGMYADFDEVGTLVQYMNEYLVTHQGEYASTDRLMVEAVSFTERAATYAMRNLMERDRQELLYDPRLEEYVRFNDLTFGYDEYSEGNFEDFWLGVQNLPLDSTGDVGTHYGKIQVHVLEQLNKLAKKYNSEMRSNLVPSLWSGNLAHELIGLTEPRSAQTLRERLDQ